MGISWVPQDPFSPGFTEHWLPPCPTPLLQGHGWFCHLVQEIQGPKASAQASHCQPGYAGPVARPTQTAQVSLRHPGGQAGQEDDFQPDRGCCPYSPAKAVTLSGRCPD